LLQNELNRNSKACDELIELLKQRNREPDVASHLWQIVLEHDSAAAAKALQGDCDSQIKAKIIRNLSLCLDGGALLRREDSFPASLRSSHWYQHALYNGGSTTLNYVSPCAPLALAGTTVPSEVDLLLKAVRHQTKILHFEHEEKNFRNRAAAALTYQDESLRKLIRLMLGTWDELVYNSAREGFLATPLKRRALWKEFINLSPRRAAYRAAREFLHCGPLRAILKTVWPSCRYRLFISDLQRLAKQTW
ncbi:MAG: hypothetical protein KDA51_00970, partial [Planctomycetales bacterium]|nr:hypothetical protein [Planctomycetales bacterium]